MSYTARVHIEKHRAEKDVLRDKFLLRHIARVQIQDVVAKSSFLFKALFCQES